MNTWTKWAGVAFLAALMGGCQTAPEPSASTESIKTAPAVAEVTQTVNDKTKAGLLAPMIERRDTLVATGYAVISVQNHKNPSQQRLLAIRAAKLDAYRALTEQVYGQHLDATTTVADMTVMSDTFRTRVEGVV